MFLFCLVLDLFYKPTLLSEFMIQANIWKDYLNITVFQTERKSEDKSKNDNPQETKTDQLAVSDVDEKTNDSDQLSLVRKRGWPKGVPRGPKNTTRRGRSANRGRAKPKVSPHLRDVVEVKSSGIHTKLSVLVKKIL